LRVLITGANGFIGRNLLVRLQERADIHTIFYPSNLQTSQLEDYISNVDFVFHLAGVNRAESDNEFINGNDKLTHDLCRAVSNEVNNTGKRIPILYTSSTQAALSNVYGISKLNAERHLLKFSLNPLIPVHIFRLPNVFGKWARPEYNSVVATFCYKIARDIPIHVHDPQAPLNLVYIDDVIEKFMQIFDDGSNSALGNGGFEEVAPIYLTTVGDLSKQIQIFRQSRTSLLTERVGAGFLRALYATYLSYLPAKEFIYDLPQYKDNRGVFVEMLKTVDSGQFSFFTTKPGVTRGGHYHHSKTEKFLIIKGNALFKFRHIMSGEEYRIQVSGLQPKIVESIPGWTHSVTNVGEDELFAMLWSSEIFDRERPDTYESPL
jgi:UDP-2-acetamido-2,6-beta-L-arabino-hexul-4-ose reductase